jgi:hypothetical protein
MKRTEGQVQLAICHYLKAKGHFFHRMNNVGVYDKKRGQFRTNHYGIKGVPDIYVYIPSRTTGAYGTMIGHIIALEVKSPIGKQSSEQMEFQRHFESAGGLYKVVRSVDDVMELGL